jgi:GT2 family glycosyltransferase
MKTVVFVLGYRSFPFLIKGNLDKIIAATKMLDNAKIVFLDNYSRDGAVRYVKENYPEIDVLVSPRNYLYCKAINNGIQYIFKKYKPNNYILVDSDNPCHIDAYTELVNFAEQYPNTGIIQPIVKKMSDNQRLYSCGHYIDEDFNCRTLKKIPNNPSDLHNLISCSISSTLIKAAVFYTCGLLDSVFEIYWESIDLSFRARQKGFRCACNIRAITYNDGGKLEDIDSYHERYYRNRNKLIFWRKHNIEIYNEVKNDMFLTYNELNNRYNQSEYGLNIQDESIRKGIEDGIRITENLLLKEIVSIYEYNKSDIILI